ncbi:ABC transporter ATP-binding protein [Kocuria rhizophila]|uniref:Fatty acid ABC transporter ATP-binding/permease protein n=1 Tax=Kocuria rhizophila (strain ATCC 9341 / DSM 348 / NBRC 103217 / DC2201) TaxID=378753 RepID=B2GFR0_KOCRD|nr:ABC transporter ATP-binding protein [Kocuria rhizophila]BAG30198.1 putative ABC transporter permease/ATP-binding protein [Kocuria rhizophila DC2201]VEH74534.1 Putative multidrug export ATP-binding/permease protein SAV1866 [Kocuria rhizophila]HBH56035.1 ABC transporter ATP-binding protein [Kocuria sp.]
MSETQEPARKPQQFWPSAVRLMKLLTPHKAALTVVVLAVVVSVVLGVWAPRVLGRAMDVIFAGVVGRSLPAGTSQAQVEAGLRAQGQDTTADMVSAMSLVPGQGVDFTRLGGLILAVLAMYTVASLLMWLQGYVLNRVVMRVVYDLRAEVERKLNALPLSYFDTRQRGDVMSRVTNDVDNIQTALQQTFAQLVQDVLTVLGIVVMMFVVSWQLALVALLALPLSAVAAGVIGTRSQRMFKQQWQATGRLNGHIEESFSGHELVHAYGRQRQMQAQFDERNEELHRAAFGAQFLSGTIMPVMQFISYLSYVGIAVLGGLRVATGQLTLGDATAFIQYSREFTQPLSQVAGMATQLQSGIASAERTFELLDAPEQEPETPTARLPERLRGEVRFEHVDFSYDKAAVAAGAQPMIEDLSLHVEPGRTVAIVGPTGAGKTTLVNLILRFYEIDGGRITLDGIDIRDLARHDLRSQVGMVLQDAWLFSGSIMENIRFGRQDATDEEVLEAARATYVDRFVRALPQGYDTVVTEDGSSVSAGEKQLITIARAFLSRPSLLILDEATSAVDTRTELLVQKAMAALRAQRTSFVIAHRLSTIRDADTIIVMRSGRIVEQGSHEQLIAAHGAYAELYEAQFNSPDTEPDAAG